MATRASTVSLDTFNELVSNIYDAAMDAALWPMFIERLTLALNAHSGLLRIQDLQVNKVGPYVTHGVNPEYQQKYVEYYIHDDPLIGAAAQHPIGTLLQTAEFLPKSFRKTEFYNDYNHPQGMDQIIGGLLVKDESRIALIGVHRRDRVGRYEQQEVRLVELLIPHLQRAFQVNSHLFQLKDGINAAHEALHRLLVGIILVDATGKPLFVNSRADTILSQARGLTLGQHGLQARTWESTQALHKLIFEACQPPQKTGGALSIATPESPHPLNILVIPVNREKNVDFGIDTSQPAAALFIGTAGQQRNLSLNVLRNFYGLTHAEARLARALANGHSLEKIAEEFRLSKSTIRTQLKSCFQKTGVHRQGELVQLILGDPTGLID